MLQIQDTQKFFIACILTVIAIFGVANYLQNAQYYSMIGDTLLLAQVSREISPSPSPLTSASPLCLNQQTYLGLLQTAATSFNACLNTNTTNNCIIAEKAIRCINDYNSNIRAVMARCNLASARVSNRYSWQYNPSSGIFSKLFGTACVIITEKVPYSFPIFPYESSSLEPLPTSSPTSITSGFPPTSARSTPVIGNGSIPVPPEGCFAGQSWDSTNGVCVTPSP